VQAVTRQPASGQALAEWALVMPLFFLILFSILQLGLLLGGQNGVVNAVRETARYAVPHRVTNTTAASLVCPAVVGKLTDALSAQVIGFDSIAWAANSLDGSTVTYTWLQDPDGRWYVLVRVSAGYRFPLYVPLANAILDGLDGAMDQSLHLSAQEEMRVENDPLVDGDAGWSVTCP